ncbi:MAG: cysteine--tRNA ligase, partial [Candidatus Binatia bacterium]
YYSVRGFPEYGKLSKRRIDELIAGARVEVDSRKRDAADFALWKSVTAENERAGEPAWPSPWGRGRPGWHIECSAMSTRLLGQPFDIHGGGEDLIFPHHENEIAQSEGASGRPFVNVFVHNSFVRLNEEKMSKSLGNVFGIREVGNVTSAEALRLFLVSTHYRSPMDFSIGGVEESFRALVRLYETLARAENASPTPAPQASRDSPRLRPFFAAMDDDLNTAQGAATLFDLVRELNRLLDAGDVTEAARVRAEIATIASVLGVGERRPAEFLETERDRAVAHAGLTREEIERSIAERGEARARKEWQRADEIRSLLLERGVVLEDAAGRTSWRPASWGVVEAPARKKGRPS